MSTISTALSGMTAATTRLEVSAQNVAGAQAVGRAPGQPGQGPEAYKPQQVVQTSVEGGGVSAAKRPQQPGYFFAYEPDAPGADDKGMVAVPDVDEATQQVEQLQALNQFKANLQSLLAGQEAFKAALKII